MYEVRDKLQAEVENQKHKHHDDLLKIEEKLEIQRQTISDLQVEKNQLLKEANEIKNIPGFRVEVLTESEREKLQNEVEDVKRAKEDLEKQLTMLKNTDDIRQAMENILMMFLSKKDDELNMLSQKQQYLIKYLFGDYATKSYKERIKGHET